MLPVVILCGGLGTRLGSITQKIPKSLIPINNTPFIHHQLNLLRTNDIDEVFLSTGHLGNLIRKEIGNGQKYGIKVTYIDDGDVLLGTAGALIKNLNVLPPLFFVLYGDSYLECDYKNIENFFFASKKLGLMTVFKNTDISHTNNVIFENHQIKCYDKLSFRKEMKHIDYGLNAFRRDAFLHYRGSVRLDLTAVFQELILKDELLGYEVQQPFYEIGSELGIKKLCEHLNSTSSPQSSSAIPINRNSLGPHDIPIFEEVE